MKIWVTRLSAGSLHAGGLGRCMVWLTKPTYHFYKKDSVIEEYKDGPFFYHESQGLGIYGWMVNSFERGEKQSLNFGDVFGYQDKEPGLDEISKYVWEKLIEHFNGKQPYSDWYIEEKELRSNEWDFLLEIDLDIKIKNDKF